MNIIAGMDDNEAICKEIVDDNEFRVVLEDLYVPRVYGRPRGQVSPRATR
jgi:hypothetical protein